MRYLFILIALSSFLFGKGCYKSGKYYDICPGSKKPLPTNTYFIKQINLEKNTFNLYCIEGYKWISKASYSALPVQMYESTHPSNPSNLAKCKIKVKKQ